MCTFRIPACSPYAFQGCTPSAVSQVRRQTEQRQQAQQAGRGRRKHDSPVGVVGWGGGNSPDLKVTRCVTPGAHLMPAQLTGCFHGLPEKATELLGAGTPAPQPRPGLLPAGRLASEDASAAVLKLQPPTERRDPCKQLRGAQELVPEPLAWLGHVPGPSLLEADSGIKGGEHNSRPVLQGEHPVGGTYYHYNCVNPVSIQPVSFPNVSKICVNQCTFSSCPHSRSFFLSGSCSFHGDVGLQTSSA